MKGIEFEDHYWAERLAAVVFESKTDLPIDVFEAKHVELSKQKLLEWYTAPLRWRDLIIAQLWGDDEELDND
jgi:hypothetical protein